MYSLKTLESMLNDSRLKRQYYFDLYKINPDDLEVYQRLQHYHYTTERLEILVTKAKIHGSQSSSRVYRWIQKNHCFPNADVLKELRKDDKEQ